MYASGNNLFMHDHNIKVSLNWVIIRTAILAKLLRRERSEVCAKPLVYRIQADNIMSEYP